MYEQFPLKHQEGDLPPIARKSKYPFSIMQVGDYFEVPAHVKSISSLAYSFGKQHKMKFSIRHMDGLTKVYRIE